MATILSNGSAADAIANFKEAFYRYQQVSWEGEAAGLLLVGAGRRQCWLAAGWLEKSPACSICLGRGLAARCPAALR